MQIAHEMASPQDIAKAFLDAYAAKYAGACGRLSGLRGAMRHATFQERAGPSVTRGCVPLGTSDLVASVSAAAADVRGLSELYGEDSVVSFDGQSVQGRAAIAAAIAPRVSATRQ
jgi:hypothetical protein